MITALIVGATFGVAIDLGMSIERYRWNGTHTIWWHTFLWAAAGALAAFGVYCAATIS